MIKRALIAAPFSLALLVSAPLAAQDDGAQADDVMIADEGEMSEAAPDFMEGLAGLFGEMFKVEPLTAEQEARLPIAQSIAAKVLPDGAMGELFKTMTGGFMGPMMEMGPPPASETVAKGLGVSTYELYLEDAEMAEVAKLFDPAYEERGKREQAAAMDQIGTIMAVMEPSMRKAMAELYAIRFEASELADLDAFFSTSTGTKYARESYAMASDPRIMAASMEAMPQMMGTIGGMDAAIAEATADLPAKRAFADLSKREKARIVALTGLSEAEIEERIAMAAEMATAFEEWPEAPAEGEAVAVEVEENN